MTSKFRRMNVVIIRSPLAQVKLKKEKQRADAEKQKATQLTTKLKEMGIDSQYI